MKPGAVSPAAFRREFARLEKRTDEAVQLCLRSPTPEAVHDARTAARRLSAAASLAPKKVRGDPRTTRSLKALKRFCSACAGVRDIDAMAAAISAGVPFGDIGRVMEELRKRRRKALVRARSSGLEMGRLAIPDPRTGRRRLNKRLDKLLAARAKRAEELYAAAASGEQKVAELHALRKECRRMAYLLEFADEGGLEPVRKVLDQARRDLGSIRDDDLLVGLLATLPGEGVVKAMAAISASRSGKYARFFSRPRGKGAALLRQMRSFD